MSKNWTIVLEAVWDKLLKIGKNSNSGDDEMALWVVTNLIYYTGLEMKEITGLKGGDVVSSNVIVQKIVVSRQLPFQLKKSKLFDFPLPRNIQLLLNFYIQHLQLQSGSVIAQSSLLFPAYFGDSGNKTLKRHLDRYGTDFMELRRAGTIAFYKNCRLQGRSDGKAVEAGASHFQKTERTIEEYTKNIHRPAGRRKEEETDVGWRLVNLYDQVQRLTEYEVFIEDRPKKLVAKFNELIASPGFIRLANKDFDYREDFLNWLYSRVRFWIKRRPPHQESQNIRPPDLFKTIKNGPNESILPVESKPIKPKRLKCKDLNKLEKIILNRIDKVRADLSAEDKERLKAGHDQKAMKKKE